MIEVYAIASPSGARYVGLTTRGFAHRWRDHVKAARSGRFSYPLHRAIRKYGAEAFTHEVLERMTTEAGAKRAEQLWIKELDTVRAGYNQSTGGESSAGEVRSPETRALLAERCSGWKHTPEARAKMSATRTGRPGPTRCKRLTVEHRAKISTALTGNPPTRGRTGQKWSEETRARMLAAYPPEARAKNLAASRRKKEQG